MSVVTRSKELTQFGRVLEHYRRRRGMSQEAFAEAMMAVGYPRPYLQKTHSRIVHNPAARVLPCYFEAVTRVLKLTVAEQQHLFSAWLSLAGYMMP